MATEVETLERLACIAFGGCVRWRRQGSDTSVRCAFTEWCSPGGQVLTAEAHSAMATTIASSFIDLQGSVKDDEDVCWLSRVLVPPGAHL